MGIKYRSGINVYTSVKEAVFMALEYPGLIFDDAHNPFLGIELLHQRRRKMFLTDSQVVDSYIKKKVMVTLIELPKQRDVWCVKTQQDIVSDYHAGLALCLRIFNQERGE